MLSHQWRVFPTVQWGRSPYSPNTVTYPVAFSGETYVVMTTSVSSLAYVTYVTNKTRTGFTFGTRDTVANPTGEYFYWVALGK